jgi:cation diffusion facilitator family transporter
MADDCCSKKGETLTALAAKGDQRRVLVIVLFVNLAMFFVEFTGGVIAGSSALMADSIDMLGDAFVYGLSLYALHRGPRWEAGAAIAKGAIILAFGVVVIAQIADKIVNGAPPSSGLMLGFGALALAANLVCLALLWRFRTLNINMSSTFECSRNDVVSNVGVLGAAALVGLTGSVWPDVAIATVIAVIFLCSAIGVLREAVPAWRDAKAARPGLTP